MTRILFSQVLKNAKVDYFREYMRLYALFCLKKYNNTPYGSDMTLKECCAANFTNLPFRGTCITLDDFDEIHGYNFEKKPSDFDLDYLISFCEYTYNIGYYNVRYNSTIPWENYWPPMQFYLNQLMIMVDSIGYMPNTQDGITDFVPKDQCAISVAEIVDPTLSYKVIEYNHYSMKGDVQRKKEIIVALAEKLEPQRNKLQKNNSRVEDDLFFLFNNMNIRHNNTDPDGKDYRPFVANMQNSELEKWYDDIYQMCLFAFLELDHIDRKDRVKQLKEEIQKNK